MGRDAIVAGTGFDGRAETIRKHVRKGMPVQLRREPENSFDPNAIAVFIETSGILGIFGKRMVQIGYIKSGTAVNLAEKLDSGLKVQAQVTSFHAPEGKDHPRVSLRLEWPNQ